MGETGHELRASWWVALTFVPFGLTTWAAFLYAGRRGGRRLWTWFAAFYFVLIYGGWTLLAWNSTGGFGFGVVAVAWLGSIGHALAIRADVNFRIAARTSAAYSYARERAVRRDQARSIAEHHPREARELGIGRPDRDGFSGDLVDLNSAPMSEIVRLPGMTSELARRIVDVREEIGGFSSLNDVGQVLSLDATLIDQLRPEVVVLPWD